MKRLTSHAFDRCRSFLLAQARPLDAERFRFHFEGGPADAVLRELAAYQNSDGGFGNALEPDFRLPASSPMATSHALHILLEVGAKAEEPLVRGAIEYTHAHWLPARRGWIDVPLAVNEHPHAPWWQRSEPGEADPAAWGNPDADLMGSSFAYAELAPKGRLAELQSAAGAALEGLPSPLTPYVALCLARLGEHAPEPLRSAVHSRLKAEARQILDLDPAARTGDHFPLHWLAETPDAPMAEALAPELSDHLDAEIDRQSEAGCWDPRWSWGPAYPEHWPEAEREWRGFESLRTLLVLRAHGRLSEGTR